MSLIIRIQPEPWRPLARRPLQKEDELAARDLLTGEFNTVYRLFEQCTSRRYVEHAEQFLEFIDTATTNPVRARMLERFWKGVPMSTIRDAAVKDVAAECDFLAEADTKEEGWQPYKRWRSEFLEKNHFVINFNYDLVLEALGEVAVLPDEDTYKNPRRLLKLHGSID